MSRLVGPLPPVLRGCAPPNRKQKHFVFFVFFEILGLVAPGLIGIHTQNAVNEHRRATLCDPPQNAPAERQAVAQTRGNIGIRV